MAYPPYIRERARELRIRHALSLDELAVRLALPKTTVYYWIKDLPLERERRWSDGQRKGNSAMRRSYLKRREDAYALGWGEYDELISLPTFRDFVVMYIAEGYKRHRHTVSICNSDPAIVAMATAWLRTLSGREPLVRVHHHADQDIEALRFFWAATLHADPAAIRFQPKSNSGHLKGRTWRCEHGVASAILYDTLLRSRLQAWIDRVRADWG
jgi:hypothetical protein